MEDWLTRAVKNAVAVWLRRQPRVAIRLMPMVTGGYFALTLGRPKAYPVSGVGRALDFRRHNAQWLADDCRRGEITFLKTPSGAYHTWHVCFCDKCGPNGRIWQHSQGDWDAHIRYAPAARVVNFPAAEERHTDEEIVRIIRDATGDEK